MGIMLTGRLSASPMLSPESMLSPCPASSSRSHDLPRRSVWRASAAINNIVNFRLRDKILMIVSNDGQRRSAPSISYWTPSATHTVIDPALAPRQLDQLR